MKTDEAQFTIMEDKFNQLVTDVAVIKTNLESFTETLKVSLKDHEDRIRRVEDFKSKMVGGLIVSNVVTGIIVGLFVKFL